MKEYFKALETIGSATIEEDNSVRDVYYDEFDILKQALTELKAIKETEPSETMKCLEKIKLGIRSGIFYSLNDREKFINNEDFNNVKKYILKAQDLEKENDEYKRVLEIIKEEPFESAATINYIKTNKDNLEMLDYKYYCMNLDVDFRVFKEEFELLKRYFSKH